MWWHFLYLIPASYFLWSAIHEYSHVVAAQKIVGVSWYKVRLIPHKKDDKWYWASVRYMLNRPAKAWERRLISAAPKIPNILACIVLPLGPLVWDSRVFLLVWTTFIGSGLVDFSVNSIGWTEKSDLYKTAPNSRAWRWALRFGGFLFVIVSVIIWFEIVRFHW